MLRSLRLEKLYVFWLLKQLANSFLALNFLHTWRCWRSRITCHTICVLFEETYAVRIKLERPEDKENYKALQSLHCIKRLCWFDHLSKTLQVQGFLSCQNLDILMGLKLRSNFSKWLSLWYLVFWFGIYIYTYTYSKWNENDLHKLHRHVGIKRIPICTYLLTYLQIYEWCLWIFMSLISPQCGKTRNSLPHNFFRQINLQ